MNNTYKERVCAVVVTYNRKQLLVECLEGILNQTRPVDGIVIIDNNSNDGTPNLLLEKGFINQLPPEKLTEPWKHTNFIQNKVNGDKVEIFYVRMHENTGGAGGFHEGVKIAYEKGYDWLWLMDDDVEPLPNCLEIMINYSHISKCIHPSKVYLDGERFAWEGWIDYASGFTFQFKKDKFIENKDWTCVNFGCFEGMLIHKSIIEKIGYPLKEFFQYGDDTYYGYLASMFTNVVYLKEIGFLKKIKKMQKTYKNIDIRTFYLSRRNSYYIAYKISQDKRIFWILTLFRVLLCVVKVISNLRIKLLRLCILAVLDGVRGNLHVRRVR